MKVKNFALVLIFLLLSALSSARFDNHITLVINTTDDYDDGVCDSIHCSLREAINAANENSGPDKITFDPAVFPPSGNGTIMLNDHLPNLLDDKTTIDATGAKVTIDGSNFILLGIMGIGLVINNSSGNTVKGLRFKNIPSWVVTGIFASDGGKANDNMFIDVLVTNSGFGLPSSPARGDAIAIETRDADSSASGNKIINCTIENNADDGINVKANDGGTCNYNVITGNIIRGNAENGVEIEAGGSGSSTCYNIVNAYTDIVDQC